MMTEGTAIIAIFAMSAIILGMKVKTFYLAKGVFGAMSSDRQIARCKGRLSFVSVGSSCS
jgi:hypothetical protein